jgi:hypothetical protein
MKKWKRKKRKTKNERKRNKKEKPAENRQDQKKPKKKNEKPHQMGHDPLTPARGRALICPTAAREIDFWQTLYTDQVGAYRAPHTPRRSTGRPS